MKDQSDGRQACAEMDAAKGKSEKNFSPNFGLRRYKLYDKIKDHVSLRAVDTVIAVVAFLIVTLLIYGIITAHPQQ